MWWYSSLSKLFSGGGKQQICDFDGLRCIEHWHHRHLWTHTSCTRQRSCSFGRRPNAPFVLPPAGRTNYLQFELLSATVGRESLLRLARRSASNVCLAPPPDFAATLTPSPTTSLTATTPSLIATAQKPTIDASYRVYPHLVGVAANFSELLA